MSGSTPALIPAAQYLRMSKDHQRYSIRNQARSIAAYAAQHGYTIVRTYTDPGESGLTLRERPGLQGLLADVIKPSRPFERVLVLDVSRWGRFQNPDQAGTYDFICFEAGAPVIYCAEQFENDGSPVMALLKQIKRVQAAEFSRELSEKVAYAQILQAKVGHKLGGARRFGFDRILVDEHDQPIQKMESGQTKAFNNQRVVYAVGSDHEVKVVRDIFTWFTRDRLSMCAIARRLNSLGVPATEGAPWSDGRVRTVLTDELVLGVYVFNRTTQRLKSKRQKNPPEAIVRTKVLEPLISRTLFDSAAKRLRIRCHRARPEEFVAAVARLYRSKGYLTGALINECAYTPSCTVLQRRYGSIQRVYELVGYRPQSWSSPDRETPATKEEMLAILRRLFERDGYVSEKTLNADPTVPSVSIYQRHFGKLTTAYRLAGLPFEKLELQRRGQARSRAEREGKPRRKNTTPRWPSLEDSCTEEFLIDCLRRLHREHGYVTANVIRADKASPPIMAFIHRFGTLLEAYDQAGLNNRRFNIWSRAARAKDAAGRGPNA